MSNVEYRFTECRYNSDKREVSGTLVNYGDVARIANVFNERVSPGAFFFDDVILNVQHDRAQPVARSGPNLTLTDDGESLQLTASLANTRAADDAIKLIDAGILRGLSAEFIVREDEWLDSGETRIIKRADLTGVGLVDRPAYPKSTLAIREQQLVIPSNDLGILF